MCIFLIRKGMMPMKNVSIYNGQVEKRTSLLLFAAVMIAGIIIGSVLRNTACFSKITSSVLNSFTQNTTWLSQVKDTFVCLLLFAAGAFIVGSSIIGQPLAYGLLLYSGIYIGLITASAYQLYSKEAIFQVLTTVLPRAFSLTAVVILSVKEALRSSSYLFSFYLNGDVRENKRISLKLYLLRFLVIIILSLILSAASGVFFYLRLMTYRK